VKRAAVLLVLSAAVATAATTANAAPRCSASGLSAELPKQNLPAAVAQVRAQIARAAVACNYGALERIGGKSFTFSFGAQGSAAAYWRRLETTKQDRPLARLVKILSLPVTRNEARAFAWPSAYTTKPTAADWERLVSAGVYTRTEVNRMRHSGNVYYGYRVGITPRGDWQFFVAGD
jgi:hypothetical protein